MRADIDWFMSTVIALDLPKVIVCDRDAYDALVEIVDPETTRFVLLEISMIERWMGFSFVDIARIQKDDSWIRAAPWLADSLQGRLPHHVAFGFASPIVMRLVSRLDPFKTRGGPFMYLSPRHQCLLGESKRLKEDAINNILNFHMDRFLMTHAYYDLITEVHGFSRSGFLKLSGMDSRRRRVNLVRGDTLAGRAGYIEVVAVLYELLVRESLKEGYMGLDESVLSIMAYRYPALFHMFSNSDSCDDPRSYDRSCPGLHNPNEACALWDAVMNGLPKSPDKTKIENVKQW